VSGHIFCNPTAPKGYMALVCYKNGSLTREDVRDRVAGGSWPKFDQLLKATAAGNDGHVGFFFKETEITPQGYAKVLLVAGSHRIFSAFGHFRFDKNDKSVASFTPEQEVRALVEGQFLSMRLHASNIGLTRIERVLATGGASRNEALMQVAADVLGAPVYVAGSSSGASVGAAYRALHGHLNSTSAGQHFVPLSKALGDAAPFRLAATPSSNASTVYDPLLRRYAALEEQVLASIKCSCG
jgi:xylulokinase